MDHVCSKCGHRLTPDEFADCPECGHRGRRRAKVRFVESQPAAPGNSQPPQEPVAAAGRDDALQLSELPRVQRVRTANYLAVYLGGWGLGFLAWGLGVGLGVLGWEPVTAGIAAGTFHSTLPPTAEGVALALFFPWMTWVGAHTAAAACCVLLYRAWQAIQDGSASTSPAAAAAYCFIPLFNLYWVFRAVFGLAPDYNSFARRHRITGVQLTEGLCLAFCICCVGSVISVRIEWFSSQMLAIPLTSLLGALVIVEVSGAINAVADAQSQAASPKNATPRTGPTNALVE